MTHNPPHWLSAAMVALKYSLLERPISIVDVGASGAPPENQACLSSVSTYLGFDPDLRIPQDGNAFGFQRHVMLAQAVTSEPVDEITFTLTQFPQCSSVLKPDLAATHRYAIGRYFTPESEQNVKATTLDQALKEADLKGVDWLKLDTQGTDLSILRSLPPSRTKRLLVVDLEPGVTPFYFGENKFAETHEHMLAAGFWLADLNQQKFPRISVETIDALGLDEAAIEQLNGNPFAAELQYFRTIESMVDGGCNERDFLTCWLLAMANNQFAFAIEVAHQSSLVGVSKEVSGCLIQLTLAECRARSETAQESTASRIGRLLLPPILPKLFNKLRRS